MLFAGFIRGRSGGYVSLEVSILYNVVQNLRKSKTDKAGAHRIVNNSLIPG